MTDKIPVAPAAHYMVGGVRSDVNGRTNIDNLYVCGELASTGIMGANRLASNSLLECLVFGYRAVEDTKEISKANNGNEFIPDFKPKFRKDPSKEEMFQSLKVRISNLMNDNAGIIRNEKLLSEGLEILENEKEVLANEKDEYYSLLSYNLITVAELIIRPAIYRKESRGGHYREDYPQEENSFIKHIIQQKGKLITAIPVDVK
ncbi:L-aspartate oxidase [bioreactor metagenome]|uniref:L-aspartate oxidase n=1 Tax=bioreactor metagenome TaxID=1076179 RepID=A0A645F5D7_9ZZZZ